MPTTCNGNSSSSSRYYYSNRPLRDATPTGAYHHHATQYHHHNHHHSFGCPSPRSRHEPAPVHQRHTANGENCCHRETDSLGYSGRSSAAYSPYLYQPIHTILSEAKPFEGRCFFHFDFDFVLNRVWSLRSDKIELNFVFERYHMLKMCRLLTNIDVDQIEAPRCVIKRVLVADFYAHRRRRTQLAFGFIRAFNERHYEPRLYSS